MKIVGNTFADLDARMSGENKPPEAEDHRKFACSASILQNRAVPPREWLVEGMIPSSTVTLLGGDGGSGKSLLAMMLAVSVASKSGIKWIGRMPKQGKVLYCGAEDDFDEMHRRLANITEANFVDYMDIAELNFKSLAGEDALLSISNPKTGTLMPTELWQRISTYVEAERPALVVFDTLADLFGGNENDRALARQFIGQLRGLAIQFKCAVLLLAHPSLSGLSSGSGTSGSTAWNNSVRSRLYLERVIEDGYESDSSARKLSVKKSNYADTGNEIFMHWKDGVFEAEPQETGLDRYAMTAKADRVFLALLDQINSQGRTVNHASGPNYAPRVFSRMPDCEGVVKEGFKGAMERLFAAGKIKVSERNSRGKVQKFLEKVAENGA